MPVQFLKGVGPKVAESLAKGGIRSFWDLLLTLPRSYEDRRHLHSFEELQECLATGEAVLGRAEIEAYTPHFAGRRRWMEARARWLAPDGKSSAPILFTWFFDAATVAKRFAPGSTVIFRAKPQEYRGRFQFVHPELQRSDAEVAAWEFGGFVPVYREIAGLSTRLLRKVMWQALQRPEFAGIPEALSPELVSRLGLPKFQEALQELHFPKTWQPQGEEMRPGGPWLGRLVFEELFMMAIALHLRRAEWRREGLQAAERVARIPATPKMDEWKKSLPFALTGDQARVMDEIAGDISLAKEPLPMHRLVQGDVGSGKTIVAFLAALAAVEAGYQAALMAPTEILADQHYLNFSKLFPQYAHEVLLLKGALTARAKREVRAGLEQGQARFVIGTQALLTDTTLFERLGLVIIDEQHRFGVEQRLNLKERGDSTLPHLLVMTATPIPRSLALTLYGDLNISSIREKPAGRIPIRTHVVRRRAHKALQERLGRFLAEGRQIYIVYPLVEESEELDLKDVISAHTEWQQRFGAEKVGLLHGRMKSAEKDAAMRAFKRGDTCVLVSTTVIEVGVDVPNASVIVIEHAERFGLSQLHQLRGRVGRGSTESFCVLVGPDYRSPLVEERLSALEASDDGFRIAEKDLEIRGPGEFLGRRQSGMPGFRVAHILRDLEWMTVAREEARRLLEEDPKLKKAENRALRLYLEKWWQGRMELTLSG